MSARVKVSLAFQLSPEHDVVRRKKVLTLQASDSIQKIYETISGRSGGPPLWPKDFGELLDSGTADAELFYGAGEKSDDGGPLWCPAPGSSVLGDLVRSSDQGAIADLLLRIVEPEQQFNVDDVTVMQDDRAMYYSRTFLHFKDEEEEQAQHGLTPRALSDPLSQRCSTPMSRASSRGSLGLMEQAVQDRQHRKYCEDYIQKKLIPHLGRSGTSSRDDGGESTKGKIGLPSWSPLRIGEQSLNMTPSTLAAPSFAPAPREEPAYLPSGSSVGPSAGASSRPPMLPALLMGDAASAARGHGHARGMDFPPPSTMLQASESPRELWERESSDNGDTKVHHTPYNCWSSMASQPVDAYHLSVLGQGPPPSLQVSAANLAVPSQQQRQQQRSQQLQQQPQPQQQQQA